MPGYEWCSAILIRPIGRCRPQLWIPPVAWAQAIRRCLTKDACPHHLQAALFCPFCPLYLNLVHIGPNFSKKGNKTDRTGIGSLSTDGIPTLTQVAFPYESRFVVTSANHKPQTPRCKTGHKGIPYHKLATAFCQGIP